MSKEMNVIAYIAPSSALISRLLSPENPAFDASRHWETDGIRMEAQLVLGPLLDTRSGKRYSPLKSRSAGLLARGRLIFPHCNIGPTRINAGYESKCHQKLIITEPRELWGQSPIKTAGVLFALPHLIIRYLHTVLTDS